jgi:hypothetical protein
MAGRLRHFMSKYLSVPETKLSIRNQKSIDIHLYYGTDMKRETHGAAIFTSVFRNPMYCFFSTHEKRKSGLFIITVLITRSFKFLSSVSSLF